MQIINILATESIEKAYTPQKFEFYLAHKILEKPFLYNKIKQNEVSYKIVDCSACELGTGVSMSEVFKAARIIGANEIILPDKVMSDDSLQMSLDALFSLTEKQLNEFKIAIVIQGSSVKQALRTVKTLCKNHDAMVMIDTIMIPKWFNTSARVILTQEVRKYVPNKNIHWLGLGDDIDYCINRARDINIRTMDTGYFLSVAQDKMTNIFKHERDRKHKIDLDHNKLKTWQIREVIDAVNSYTYKGASEYCKLAEDIKDAEFATNLIKVMRIIMIALLAICFCFIFMVK